MPPALLTLASSQASVSRSLSRPLMTRASCCSCMLLAEGGVPAEVARFVVPLVMGSLQQLPAQALPGTNPARTAVVSLIARRSVGRPGVRHWRRGANLQVQPGRWDPCGGVVRPACGLWLGLGRGPE